MSITNLTLFKRYNGIFYITYLQDGLAKWKSTKKRTKHEALKVLSEFEQYLKQDVPKVLFADFVIQFLTLRATDLRQSTIKQTCIPTFKAFERLCGNKLLSAYTLRDVEYFKSKRLENCSPITVNIGFRVLRAAFNYAIKLQLLSANPFMKSSALKAREQYPTYLTKDDLKKLLDIVEESVLEELFLFAALTGLRLGEIVNLTWTSINFQQRTILIKNTEDFVTKSGKQRIVPMSELVINLLSRKELTQRFCKFVFQLNGRQVSKCYVSHKFKYYTRQLGLNDKVHFHSLRHTFATWLVQEGVNVYEVQKLLGHSSVKVTEIYSHLAAAELHNAVNKIDITFN